MKVVMIFLIAIIGANALCCMYCSYRKSRDKFRGIDSYGLDGQDVSQSELNDKPLEEVSLKRKLISFIHHWMGSILRVCLFATSYIPSHHVRNFFYRVVFRVSMGKNAIIYYGVEIRSPWNLYISDGAVIGDKCILDARSGIYIGKNVNFSSEAAVWTMQHNVNAPDFGTVGEEKAVFIFDRVWVSTRAVILPGCVLNEGSVIAGGGYCTKMTEAFGIYGGVPCKKIGTRNMKLSYEFNGSHFHFL